MEKGAVISECQNYRYSLWRIWDESKPLIGFIGVVCGRGGILR